MNFELNSIRLPLLILASLLSFAHSALKAQDTTDKKKENNLLEMVDTLFIDRDINHWSVRALANFKDNNFKLRNENYVLSYTPNNRSGIGFGLLSSKLLLDLIFNIKTNKQEITDRFDMQGNLLINQNLLVFQVQNYRGFNARNTSIDDPGIFRRDIRSFSTSLSFIHIFSAKVNTLNTIYSGMNPNYPSAGSFLAGIYGDYHRVKADSSIVPDSSKDLFNEKAQIELFKKFSIGVSGGYTYFLRLPANMFVRIALTPGIGLNFRDITTETLHYKPSNLWEFYLYANIALGYNGPRFYVELSDENTWNFASLDHGNRGSMNATKLKLAFGWKLRKK